MLTAQVPMLLALLGTALMAVVIFAPSREPSRMPRHVAFSLAPPQAPPVVPRWEPAPADISFERAQPVAEWGCPDAAGCPETAGCPEVAAPTWPGLLDPRAAGCDAAARLGLVEALGTVRAPWSDAILRRALDDEPDSAVRDAVMRTLAASAAG